jgi:predicted  nucleic acid-binding Zn-ribbon protein
MPEGCRVKRAGVWTSVKRHATQKAELERLLREIRSTQATLREYRENVKSEREALASYFQSTSSELKSIAETIKSPTFSWQSAAMGFATGAAVCGGVVIGGAF